MVFNLPKVGVFNRCIQAAVLSSAFLAGCSKTDNKAKEILQPEIEIQISGEDTKSQANRVHLLQAEPNSLQYPETKKVEKEENWHGVKVLDEYTWLEGANQDVKDWTAKQNTLTRTFLDSHPKRKEIETSVKKLFETGDISNITVKGNKEFQWRRTSNQNLRVLYVKDRSTNKEDIVIDPNTLSRDGTTTISSSGISNDGKFMAYEVTVAGREQSGSFLKIRNVETKQDLEDTILHAKFSSVAWLPDSSGFYYSRYPEPGTVPKGEEFYHRKIYFHKLGADCKKDPLVFAPKNFASWTQVEISKDGNWLTFIEMPGAEKNDVYVARRKERPEDLEIKPLFVNRNSHLYPVIHDNYIYLQTNYNAPKSKVMRVSLDEKDISDISKWQEVIKEEKNATLDIFSLQVAGGKLVLNYTENVQSKLKIYDLKAGSTSIILLPAIGTVTSVNGNEKSNELFYTFESFIVPPTVYKVDLNTLKQEKASELKIDLDFSNVEIRQVTYSSKDGTKIPMFLVHKKGLVKNGENKVQLYGYGGFGVNITPMYDFLASDLHWIQKGNVLAIANIRGGGEFGEEWHRAAILEKRQNAYDDFIRAAEYLIKEGYTKKERLAIRGVSNGGLMVGVVATQRPDLFGAVVSQVPLMDMLHYHKSTVGKLWMSEYGDPENPDHFKFLYKYSPYHNVREKTDYPSMLIIAGEGDERVDPMHARKMTARLQATTASNNPILLLVYSNVGHGARSQEKEIQTIIDVETFLEKTLK